MIFNKRTSIFLVMAMLIGMFLVSAMVKQPSAGDSHMSCHTVVAQEPGQEQGEEEGNPGHKRPERSCSHKPTTQQVRCHCQTDCKSDGTQREDYRCRSYCYKDMCTCPRKNCA
jgi:hypothetical protein